MPTGEKKEIKIHYYIMVDGEPVDMGEVGEAVDIGNSWITTGEETHLFLKFKDGTERHFIEVTD